MVKKVFLFALSATVMLAGCSKTEVVSVQDENDVISFQTIVGSQKTKAILANDVKYPTDETFGTFAYFNAAGTTFPTGAETYIPESEVKYFAASGSTNAYWSTATPYYWPKQGSLAFFSYSPYDELNTVTDCTTTGGVAITGWDVDAKQEVDVMVADVKTNRTANETYAGYQGVPTTFRHKLAQVVKITFKTEANYNGGRTESTAQAGDKFFYVNSVKINGVDFEGDYVSGNNVSASQPGSWTVKNSTTERKTYTWFSDGATGATSLAFNQDGTVVTPNSLPDSHDYLLVLPQSLPAATEKASDTKNIQITYTIKSFNGSTFSTETVKDVYVSLYQIHEGTASAVPSWAINTRYSYTFTVGLDQIKWAPAVEDWNDASFGITI